MKNKKWNVLGAAAIFVLAFTLGAVTPGRVEAGPRTSVWSVGDNTNKILKNGTFVVEKPIEMTVNSSQGAIVAGSTILSTAAYQLLTADSGATTLTSTPNVSTTTAEGLALPTGKMIILVGTDDTDTVILQDDDQLAGTQLELGAATRTLGANDVLVLIWQASASTTGRWLEVSFSNLD